MFLFLFTLKTSENLWFSNVFRGYGKESLTRSELKRVIALKIFLKFFSFSFIAVALDAFLKKSIFSMMGISNLQLFLLQTDFILFAFVFRVICFKPCSTLPADCVFTVVDDSLHARSSVIKFETNFQIYWTHLFFA